LICDFHAPIYNEPDYASMLAETAQNLGFDKLCIRAGRRRYGLAPNAHVLKYADAYPDLFVPFGHLSPGTDGAQEVERLAGRSFAGICLDAPPAAYDEPQFFPVYEAAACLGVPLFFHTGYLPPSRLDRALGLRSSHMRPTALDTIARQFPRLTVVGSGLGGPWFEEAAETLRWEENAFFDLSGSAIRNRGAAFFRSLLGPRPGPVPGEDDGGGAWSRVVFGTGAHYNQLASVERDYQRLLRALALPDEVVGDIMGGNAARILGLDTGS
jgi:hypothetical protein